MHNAKPGHCKFCGDPITNKKGTVNKRASWHPACALTWTIMNNPSEARRFVYLRDRGICRGCGKDCHPIGEDAKRELCQRIMTQGMHTAREPLGEWEVDHEIPLFEAARRGKPMNLYQLGNMQSLCHPCHANKTREDTLLYEASCSTARSKDAHGTPEVRAQLTAKLTTTGYAEPAPPTSAQRKKRAYPVDGAAE